MDKVIGFHRPEEAYGFLSNWYIASFEIDGRTFNSIEQYMMYKKAVVFGDLAHAEEVLRLSDAEEIKAIGRKVTGYNDTVWNGIRQIIVYEGLLAKFGQNPDLKKQLLATGGAVLAECNPDDPVWGIALPVDDDRRLDMKTWQGTNYLGFLLMLVRDKLAK
ncbi:MAG: NADAR family protein [Eubacteriales bacterium]|nr:NADAR family protein [Eubacteriales bacterium]